MTHDYGPDAAPRGHGDSRQGGPAHRSPYERGPQWTGGDQYGNRPQGTGYGQPQMPPGAPAGYPVPHQRPASPADAVRPVPYRDGGHAGPAQYGNAPTRRAAGQQPPDGFNEPQRSVVEQRPARRSRKPLVFVIILILLAAGGGGWYYLTESADQAPTEQDRRIADQQADPVPLTEAELFPAGTITGATTSYKILKTQAVADCATAAAGAVVEKLATAGCSQVVRATLMTTDKVLVITAGVFNLESQQKAEKAAAAIKTAVDEGKGRFGGLVAGGESDIIGRASASLTWDVRGHYLVYCVIAHSDGSAVPEDDPRAQAIRVDLVEKHIEGVVIQNRQNGGT
jgi:hypothetical protein